MPEQKHRQPMELAVRRAYDELAPMLGDRLSVDRIVVQSALHRRDGEYRWLDTIGGDGALAHTVWLAFRPAGRFVHPEGVAAILADALLALAEREGHVVPLVGLPVAVAVLKDKDSAGMAPRPRTSANKEAEGMLVEFRPSPLGHDAVTPN
jgi:hypothetical protein